jgi:hypothetical protein
VGAVILGVDVGQRRDPTAIAVVEREYRPRASGSGTELHHVVRHLEALALGTPYPGVAVRVAEVAAGVAERTGARPMLYLDATGVGQPVVDVLRQARVKADLVGVYFTHGDRRTVVTDEHDRPIEVKLGKAWLVSRLQALLQGGQLHLPRTEIAALLSKELLDYEIKIDQNANDTYGAFRVGSHDDLVTAIGLAVQGDPPRPVPSLISGVAEVWRARPTLGGERSISVNGPPIPGFGG